MNQKTIRTGLVGAGYIATWHGDAIKATGGVEITAVCDPSLGAAESLAQVHGARAFTSLDALIEAGVCDAVHILTPPQLHCDLALKCLGAGLHTFVEKPVALSLADTRKITKAAESAGRVLAVGHNFLGIPGYERLKQAVETGALGRVSSAEINWRFPLVPLRSGPFTLWLLRQPENLLLELGPHLYAFAVDLFGPLEGFHLSLAKPINLPGGDTRFQSWRILARAGEVDITFNLSLVETMDDRSVAVFGSSAIARLDYANDTLKIIRENAADIVLNPFLRQTSLAWQALREGVINATRQAVSLNRKSPYGLGFRGVARAFYAAVRTGGPVDSRFSGASAELVMGAIGETLKLMPSQDAKPEKAPAKTRKPKPSVLVIGGTGFIGSHLTRALVTSGRDVRVASRGSTGPFDDLPDRVETVSVSLKSSDDLRAAMQGCDAVYHLAKSMDKTWQGCLENDVAVTERIAEAALDQGVKRFVYTGTIASYDMSRPDRQITEQTGFAQDMSDRNLYARSKAVCEARLLAMQRDRGLPLVIARPGIVVGAGGPLQHWGIGRWHGAGTIRIWGHGRNLLPFVLIDDVSDALVRILDVDEAVGQSFNLVGEPMMSARDYFDAIHSALGARIQVRRGSLLGFYSADFVKYTLKRYGLRRTDAVRASLKDWKSRAHFSGFKNDHPKKVLGWEPEQDRGAFIRKAIVEANLFGF